MTQPATPTETFPSEALPPEQEEKLRELTTQSWNLELVISGAALVSVLQLPDLLNEGFDYLHYNLMSQSVGFSAFLPGLAFIMMKAMCYVLFVAFLANFVMRAFWVGLVGLLSVYPTGIHYDRIPFSTKYAQGRMATELGPLNAYILRLDQRCNIVFAVSFLFVFLLVFVALGYLVLLLVYVVLRPTIPAPYWYTVKVVFYGLIAAFYLAMIVLNLPKVKAHPRGEALHYQLTSLSKLLVWGLYKPYSFIINTFYSHLPYKQVLRTGALMMGILFVLIIGESVADASRVYGGSTSTSLRHLFTSRVDSRYVNANAYNDQRAGDAYVDRASIQSDVIREPFLRVYVAYPKALDTLLKRITPEPVWDKKLPREEQRRLSAEWSSGQISRLMRFDVNDSLYQKPDMLFTQLGAKQQRGWQTVLLPTNLKTGKNLLKISIQPDSTKTVEPLITIPFWYVPES